MLAQVLHTAHRPRQSCGSGHARETGGAVDGTGCAGVRGRARSHRVNANVSKIEQDSCSHRYFHSPRYLCPTVGAALAAKRPAQPTHLQALAPWSDHEFLLTRPLEKRFRLPLFPNM
ncbi:hypothetical protein C6A77_17265 [Pseudomonas sp. AFG_SD02_1510_Pfu_092]|nr:hypothetical protein C6A77_17265 [Pseudomonas sp. AFG_SD02_1510_Pfu_092]